MSKEQIKEMARITAKAIEKKVCTKCEDCKWRSLEKEDVDCTDLVCAEALYNAGYRKQSEWISVEERLPTHEENDQGLVGIVNGHNGKIGFIDAFIFVNYDFDECKWFSDEFDLANCKVDYWMVIPILTKMKGGAE